MTDGKQPGDRRGGIALGILAALLVTIVVVVGAVSLLRPGGDDAAEAPAAQSPETVAARPDCPGDTVGGVELPCLGGGVAAPPAADAITVVNLWAWWCEPCRSELPLIDAYAARHPEITVVGVHADPAAERGAGVLEELDVDLPSYQDSDNAFGAQHELPGVVPTTVVFRGEERVALFPGEFRSGRALESAVAEAAKKAS